MLEDEDLELNIFYLEMKIEKAENNSSGGIEDESRLDDLHCDLLELLELKGKRTQSFNNN